MYPDVKPDDWPTIPGDYVEPRTPAKGWPWAVKPVEDALKTLREARTPAERQRAAEAVEKALQRLREQLKIGSSSDKELPKPLAR